MEIKKISRVTQQKYSPVDVAIARELTNKASFYLRKSYETKSREYMEYAVMLYLESIKVYSREIDPYISLAYISFTLGQYDNAMAMLIQARKLSPLSEDVAVLSEEIRKARGQHKTQSRNVVPVSRGTETITTGQLKGLQGIKGPEKVSVRAVNFSQKISEAMRNKPVNQIETAKVTRIKSLNKL